MNTRLNCNITTNTDTSWYQNNNQTIDNNFIPKLHNSLQPKTRFQDYKYKTKLSLQAKLQPKESSHSVLGRFHAEFQKTVSNNITQKQQQMKKMLTLHTSSLEKSLRLTSKRKANGLPMNNYINTTTQPNSTMKISPHHSVSSADNDNDNDNDNSSYSSYAPTKKTATTFTQPDSIVSKSRLRSYNIPYNEKWKSYLGLDVHEIQYTNIILSDVSFQYTYIRDEMKVLFESFLYYKRNFLSSWDILSAFKNKEIHCQINHNKTLEETISFLDYIPKIILKDFYQYTDSFIAVESVPRTHLKKVYITNEGSCYIYNAKLLHSIGQFAKCCFEVYLTVAKQVPNYALKLEDFNKLRGLLEKTRYNLNNIITQSKSFLKDLTFDRRIIEQFHPVIIEDKEKPKVIRKKLDELIHQQYQFGRNDTSMKIKRMNNALYNGMDDKDKKRKERVKNFFGKPMEVLNSRLMTKLLKYCKKDVREKIISLRTIERYQNMSTNTK